MLPAIPLRIMTSVIGVFLGYYVGWLLENKHPYFYDKTEKSFHKLALSIGYEIYKELDSSDEDDYDCICGNYGNIATSDEETQYSDSD